LISFNQLYTYTVRIIGILIGNLGFVVSRIGNTILNTQTVVKWICGTHFIEKLKFQLFTNVNWLWTNKQLKKWVGTYTWLLYWVYDNWFLPYSNLFTLKSLVSKGKWKYPCVCVPKNCDGIWLHKRRVNIRNMKKQAEL